MTSAATHSAAMPGVANTLQHALAFRVRGLRPNPSQLPFFVSARTSSSTHRTPTPSTLSPEL